MSKTPIDGEPGRTAKSQEKNAAAGPERPAQQDGAHTPRRPRDEMLDVNGQPVGKGSKASRIYPGGKPPSVVQAIDDGRPHRNTDGMSFWQAGGFHDSMITDLQQSGSDLLFVIDCFYLDDARGGETEHIARLTISGVETMTENDEKVASLEMREAFGEISYISDEEDRIEMFIMWEPEGLRSETTAYSTVVLHGASLRYRIELSVAPD